MRPDATALRWRVPWAAIIPPLLAFGAVATGLLLDRYSPSASPFVTIAIAVALLLPAWLLLTANTAAGLAVLLVYLACFDGYLKLSVDSSLTTALRDVLLLALALGASLRWLLADRPLRVPPLTGLVVAWVVVVLVNILNPSTASIVHGLAALRQHIEFVPLFFLAFATMRTKARLRNFLLLLCAVAAINGVVGVVQSTLTPEQLAAWGPGYAEKIRGNEVGGPATRTFADDTGTTRVRPLGLGGDSGAGGGLCGLALPALFSLMLLRRDRRTRAFTAALAAALLAGIVTSQARAVVLASVIGLVAYLVVFTGRRSLTRTLAVALVVGFVLYVVVGAISGSDSGAGLSRYDTISPDKALETAYEYRIGSVTDVPTYAVTYPLGAGLGVTGPAAGATPEGLARSEELELNAEGQLNFLVDETGIPGLLVFMTLFLALLRRGIALRRIEDPDLVLLLGGCVGVLFWLFANGWAGPFSGVTPGSAIFWFVGGVIAYWTTQVPRHHELESSSHRVRLLDPSNRPLRYRSPFIERRRSQ